MLFSVRYFCVSLTFELIFPPERMWTQAADSKKIAELEGGFGALRENLKTGVDMQHGLFAKDIAQGFDARAAENVLKGKPGVFRTSSGY